MSLDSLADFHFLRPLWVLALIPLLGLGVWLQRQKKRHGNWAAVCDPELLPFLLQARSVVSERGVFWPLALAFLLAVIAMAGPSWERLPAPAFRNDAGLVIALNLSESMNAADIKPSRLIRSRYKIADLLKQRRDGQTALLVYTRQAFTVTPLTDDVNTILSQLKALRTDIMPVRGRNTLAAIRQAVDLLHQAGLQQGDILLITDGVEDVDASDVKKARQQYRVSVLAVGTEQGAPIQLPGGGFLKDSQGNIIVAGLKLKELKRLAKAGGGELVRLSAGDKDIQRLSRLFNRLSAESQQKSSLKLDVWQDFGPWLLWLVVPLAAMGFRKGLLVLVFMLMLPVPENSFADDKSSRIWNELWRTPDQQAQQAFEQQQFERAAKLFKTPAWRAAAQYRAGQYEQAAESWQKLKTPEGHYNRGNALAKAGKLTEAIKAYQQALKMRPDFEAARENKKIVEELLKKQKQQQKQPSQSQDSSSKQSSEQSQSSQDENDQKKDDQENDERQNGQNSSQNPDQSSSESNARQNDEPSGQKQEDQADEKASQDKKGKQAEVNEQQATDEATKPDAEKAAAAQALSDAKPDEDQQAVKQWLNRIPDDPSGLLKRKFRYQYQQRRR